MILVHRAGPGVPPSRPHVLFAPIPARRHSSSAGPLALPCNFDPRIEDAGRCSMPAKAKESLSFRRRPNLPKLTFPVDRSSKLMNHPSSTSTLGSTLCYRSNHRSLPLSPCLAQLKRQSLSEFSCRFLLIKFQPPNKAYSLAGAVPDTRPYPSSASQTSA